MDKDFGVKELYDVTFRLTYPDNILGTDYEEDEVILRFDRLDMAILNEIRVRTSSNGGYLNKTQIYWDEPRNIRIQMTKGIVNKRAMSILTNNNLFTSQEVEVPITEQINSIGISKYNLKYNIDLNKPYFLYRDNKKIDKSNYSIKDNYLILKDENYTNLVFDYYTNKKNQEYLRIGQNLIGGFLKMEGKTRLKDDTDGQEKTGIITIPKVRIMSDLSLRLGEYQEPYAYGFIVEGEPVGLRGDSYICDIQFLDTDIDADIV